ncbi:MAG: peroxiredoxin [Sphingobacteriales bacterium]|nr:MAG: peroxiredoxin [Sphingobacteriales bacterium]
MNLQTGDKAPDFTLYSSDKKEVSLSDYKGQNVVILFFPQAFTGTCTKELCGVRDTLHDFKSLNANVLAISVDSVYTLAKWKADEQFNFEMLSDFNKEVSELYGSIYETFGFGMKGVSKRSAFVVDKEGIIRYAEVLENASLEPDIEAVKKTLSELN